MFSKPSFSTSRSTSDIIIGIFNYTYFIVCFKNNPWELGSHYFGLVSNLDNSTMSCSQCLNAGLRLSIIILRFHMGCFQLNTIKSVWLFGVHLHVRSNLSMVEVNTELTSSSINNNFINSTSSPRLYTVGIFRSHRYCTSFSLSPYDIPDVFNAGVILSLCIRRLDWFFHFYHVRFSRCPRYIL